MIHSFVVRGCVIVLGAAVLSIAGCSGGGGGKAVPVAVDDVATTLEDAAVTIEVLANDLDSDSETLSIEVVTGPAGGGVSPGPDGTLVYTPSPNFNGSDAFTYRSSDGALVSSIATVTVTVDAVNDAPVIAADSYTALKDGSLLVNAARGLLANDTDVEGTIVAELQLDVANGALTLNADGSFSYVPNVGFVGADSFTYLLDDGVVQSGVVTVAIDVAPLSIAATEYYTISGTAGIVPGECAGFEITANAGLTTAATVTFLDPLGQPFTTPFTVYKPGASGLPLLTLVSDSTLKVGLDFEDLDFTQPTGPYPCLNYGFGDLFEVGQSYGVLVSVGGANATIDSVFTVGAVRPATAALGSEGILARTLAAANEFDSFDVTSGDPAGATVVTVFGVGTSFQPSMSLFTTSGGEYLDSTNSGFFMIIERGQPSAGIVRPVVRHFDASTGPGFPYTINVSTAGLLTPNVGSDTCVNGAPQIAADTVFTVHLQVDAGANNYNPAGAPGCSDVHSGAGGVVAPGKDVVYRLAVPATSTVVIGGLPSGSGGDTVLYLLPDTGAGNEGANCPAAPTTCAAAADIYGTGSTDSLSYRNITGATQNFYLVVDDAGTSGAPMTIAIDFQ